MQDTVNAFIEQFRLEGATAGPLKDLTFAVKDLYDVKGHVTGFGSPDWARGRPPAAHHAAVVQALLDAGATCLGKTHTDELAYSLVGRNAHYGTPTNPAAPDRVPGGSSSGSAAAVAAGLVDIAIGSDTGGSVRGPANFCGIYGLRTTHGRLPMAGAMALAESFDVAGWFARDAHTLMRAAPALGLTKPADLARVRLLMANDLFDATPEDIRSALAPMVAQVVGTFGPATGVDLAAGDLDHGFDVFRTVQAAEAWAQHKDWIETTNPNLGPGIRDRFAFGKGVTAAEAANASAAREVIAQRLYDLLGSDGILVLPTYPVLAPHRETGEGDLDAFRAAVVTFTCFAGLAKLPQLNIPAGKVDGVPVGLSLLGARDADEQLLAMAVALAQA